MARHNDTVAMLKHKNTEEPQLRNRLGAVGTTNGTKHNGTVAMTDIQTKKNCNRWTALEQSVGQLLGQDTMTQLQ